MVKSMPALFYLTSSPEQPKSCTLQPLPIRVFLSGFGSGLDPTAVAEIEILQQKYQGAPLSPESCCSPKHHGLCRVWYQAAWNTSSSLIPEG